MSISKCKNANRIRNGNNHTRGAETAQIINEGVIAEVNLSNAQLFSLKREGMEVMWQGGSPNGSKNGKGWPNSEIVMFPIIGSAPQSSVLVGRDRFLMAKHGFARDMPWDIYVSPNGVTMIQTCEEGHKIEKGERVSIVPRSYKLIKTYSIKDDGSLVFGIEIENRSKTDMPFAVGWHPAFVNAEDSAVTVRGKNYFAYVRPAEIRAEKGGVIVFDNSDFISYITKSFALNIEHSFGSTQIWNGGHGLVAIEPITARSLSESKAKEPLDLASQRKYAVLKRGERKDFEARITIVS